MKSFAFLLVLIAVAAFALHTPEPEAQAAGCSTGRSQRAVKTGGGSAYPSVCSNSYCRPPGHTTIKTGVTTGFPPLFYTVFAYRSEAGAPPANACPFDVQMNAWFPF